MVAIKKPPLHLACASRLTAVQPPGDLPPPRWRKSRFSAILAPVFTQPEFPWAWAISLTVWLTVARAHFIFFIILWLVCWAAREKIWRDTYLIAPLENMVKRILH